MDLVPPIFVLRTILQPTDASTLGKKADGFFPIGASFKKNCAEASAEARKMNLSPHGVEEEEEEEEEEERRRRSRKKEDLKQSGDLPSFLYPTGRQRDRQLRSIGDRIKRPTPRLS